ncbi:MAG: hypothetical protein ACFFBZ_00080 [Promethearchaeota archaeon]
MPYQLSELAIKQFFNEIYHILIDSAKDTIEIWCEMYDIRFLKKFNDLKLHEFVNNFEFISIKKGPYNNYFAINKILFIIEAINILKLDIKKLSNLLDYNGFEYLIQEILTKNGYRTVKNYRFSDRSYFRKKTNQKKYEIDIIGLDHNYLLVIDAKQWKKRDIYSMINKAANLQYQRALVLQKNPEILSSLMQSLIGQRSNWKIKMPIIIIPLMVTLEENWIKISENFVPLVSIYRLNSFLQEIKKNLSYFRTLKISKISLQQQIF